MPEPPLWARPNEVPTAPRTPWRRRSRPLLRLLAAASATATAAWVVNFRRNAPGRDVTSSASQQDLTGDVTPGGSSLGLQHQQQEEEKQQQHGFFVAPDGPSAPGVERAPPHRHQEKLFQLRVPQPRCAESDDPEYACLVPHPPGSFEGEIMVYLSLVAATGDDQVQQQRWQEQLSVKVVVPPAPRSGRGEDGGRGKWASLGFSPNGRMAGPSEAVVGFVGTTEAGDQEPAAGVLRYQMDGYRFASVTPLPLPHQILTEQTVETTADGSLVVRFKRPLLERFSPVEDACAAATAGAVEEDLRKGSGEATTVQTPEPPPAAAACLAESGGVMGWLDPSQEGAVLLWAYGRGAWPSYHDAAGAFVLPRMASTLEID